MADLIGLLELLRVRLTSLEKLRDEGQHIRFQTRPLIGRQRGREDLLLAPADRDPCLETGSRLASTSGLSSESPSLVALNAARDSR